MRNSEDEMSTSGMECDRSKKEERDWDTIEGRRRSERPEGEESGV